MGRKTLQKGLANIMPTTVKQLLLNGLFLGSLRMIHPLFYWFYNFYVRQTVVPLTSDTIQFPPKCLQHVARNKIKQLQAYRGR